MDEIGDLQIDGMMAISILKPLTTLMFPFVLLQSFKGGSARNRRPPPGRLSAQVSAGMDRKVLIYSATEHLDDMPLGDKDDAEESHWAWPCPQTASLVIRDDSETPTGLNSVLAYQYIHWVYNFRESSHFWWLILSHASNPKKSPIVYPLFRSSCWGLNWLHDLEDLRGGSRNVCWPRPRVVSFE